MLIKMVFSSIILFIVSIAFLNAGNELLLVQKNQLFELSFHSERMQNRYYIADYDRHLISYFGNEYFPAKDEVVYYFKPINTGKTEINIIKNINGDRKEIVYDVIISDIADNIKHQHSNIISPVFTPVKEEEPPVIEPTVEYELPLGLPEMSENNIIRKVNLINDLYNNGFYENAIDESQKLLRNHLTKGTREELKYIIANAQLNLENYDEAIDTVESLNDYDDDYINRSRIEFFKSQVYFDNEDYDNSILSLLRLINVFDDEFYIKKGKFLLAKANNNIGKTDKSISQLNEIVENYPNTHTRAEALYLLGQIFEKNISFRNYYKAADYYRLLYNDYPDLDISFDARNKSRHIRRNFF